MSCIDPGLIQRYIDKEATSEETVLIEGHIKHCEACAAEIDKHQKLVTQIKGTLNLLNEEIPEIPEFQFLKSHKKRHSITIRKVIYSVAAASVITLVLIITQNNKRVDENNEFLMQVVEYEYDANRTISDQDLIIEVIDPEGNLTEYFIE